MALSIRPVLLDWPTAPFSGADRELLRDWEEGANLIIEDTRAALRELTGMDVAGVLSPGRIVVSRPPSTMTGFWRWAKDFASPNELTLMWVIGWPFPVSDGVGRNNLATMTAGNLVDHMRRPTRLTTWLVLHEMLHALGLPHFSDDPYGECASQTVMCYSAAKFAAGQVGLMPSEVEHLQNSPSLERVDREMYQIRDASPAPLAVTRRPRTRPIHQIQIHTTRGDVATDLQVQATENWFANPLNDKGGWGGSADFVVGHDRRIGGNIAIVRFGDWLNTFSSWSAGYGRLGPSQELGAAEVGVAIEVAQRSASDPIDFLTHDVVAWLCVYINQMLVAEGLAPIPVVHLTSWTQLRSEPIPRGYIGHDELANGVRLGKTDPGSQWNWDYFLRRVEHHSKLGAGEVSDRQVLENVHQILHDHLFG